jgi:hypothetical protein
MPGRRLAEARLKHAGSIEHIRNLNPSSLIINPYKRFTGYAMKKIVVEKRSVIETINDELGWLPS